jgi:predicted aspartyl protease
MFTHIIIIHIEIRDITKFYIYRGIHKFDKFCVLRFVLNPLTTAVASLGVKLFHVLNTMINIKDIF